MKNFIVFCLLALFAEAMAWAPQEKLVNCVRINDCRGVECPRVIAKKCSSCRTMQCGCCKVCVVFLPKGAVCAPFVPTNGVCRPGTSCVGGTCQQRQNYRQKP